MAARKQKYSSKEKAAYRRFQQINWLRAHEFAKHLPGSSATYKILLFIIISMLDDQDCCFPSLRKVTEYAGLKSHTHVSRLLGHLEQAGYIKRKRRFTAAGYRTTDEIEFMWSAIQPVAFDEEKTKRDGKVVAPAAGLVLPNATHITDTNNKSINKTTINIEQQEVGVYPSDKHFLNTPLEHEKEKQGIFSGYEFPSMFKIANIQKDFYLTDKDFSQALTKCYLSDSIVGYDKVVPNNSDSETLPPEMKSSSFVSRKMAAAVVVVGNHIQQLTKSPHVRVSLWFELARVGYPLDLYPKLKRFLPGYKLPNDQSSILHSAFQSNGQLAAPLLAMTILEWSDLIPEWDEKYPRLDTILKYSEELVAEYSRRLSRLITILLNDPELCGASEIWNWIPIDFTKSCYKALSSQSENL